MYRRLSFVILCIICFAFTSCIKDLEQEGIYTNTRLYGIVMDSRTSQPLEGIRVIAQGAQNFSQTVYTANDGTFEITIPVSKLNEPCYIYFDADSLYGNYEMCLEDIPLGVKEYYVGDIYVQGPDVPYVSISEIDGVTATSVHCYGIVEDAGNSVIVDRGFVYSTMQYPTLAASDKVQLGGGDLEFDCDLPLNPHTTYYIRAYAINGLGVGYSDQWEVSTLDGLAVLSTQSVSLVTATTATSGGEVLSDGGFEVTAYGICWSTSPEPTVSNAHTVSGSGLGSFTSKMSNLEPNTTYYVRSYAVNASGVAYGNQVAFTTLSGLPTVTTSAATTVTSTYAQAGGNVVSDGGFEVIRRGVCYGTFPQPTITGSHTTDGTGTGEFDSYLTNLNPGTTYYYRAYATNGVGTVYGEQFVLVAW